MHAEWFSLRGVQLMLHKCANPGCIRPFRRLTEGKLFLIEINASCSPGQSGSRRDGQTPHRIEHFWLCEECAAVLTLSFEKGRGMVTVPLPESIRKRPGAVCNTEAGNAAGPAEQALLKRA